MIDLLWTAAAVAPLWCGIVPVLALGLMFVQIVIRGVEAPEI